MDFIIHSKTARLFDISKECGDWRCYLERETSDAKEAKLMLTSYITR